MTRAEFRRQLNQLREVVCRGLAYYAVWKGIRVHDEAKAQWPLAEQNKLLGRFVGFFTPVGIALLDMALLQFAKVFDRHPKTASLTNLLVAAEKDSCLVPHFTGDELRKTRHEMDQSEALLATLKQMRDQQLAHLDANPTPVHGLLSNDFDKLIEFIKSSFNTLSTGNDESGVLWDYLPQRSEQHTAQVLGILLRHIEHEHQEHEEEMVRIGLAEARQMESLIGYRLNNEGVRSAIESLGLTEEQIDRVVETYSSQPIGKPSS